ncbi:hypothetical protein KJ564_05490, partial [bacterium]|nr:hypothetical protein [bacterium]
MQRLLISLTFAVLLASIIASAQTIIPGGYVSGSWEPSGSPYLIQGTIYLDENQILAIEPGVHVIFQGYYKFNIEGMLQAIGTESDSITFTAADTSEGWHGLRFYDLNSQPDSSRLVYCVLEYGRASGVGNSKYGGAVYATNSDLLRLSHCTFSNNSTGDVFGHHGPEGAEPGGNGGTGESVISGHGGAVYLNDSSLLITNCVFKDNRTGNATGGNGGDGQYESIFIPWQGAAGGDGGDGGNGTSGSGGAIYIHAGSP